MPGLTGGLGLADSGEEVGNEGLIGKRSLELEEAEEVARPVLLGNIKPGESATEDAGSAELFGKTVIERPLADACATMWVVLPGQLRCVTGSACVNTIASATPNAINSVRIRVEYSLTFHTFY